MLERVITNIPNVCRKNCFDNVAAFKELWDKEAQIDSSLRKGKISLVSLLENG